MGWRVRRSFKIAPGVRLNVGKHGPTSVSSKLGPVTVNSRRGATIRAAKGVSYTTGVPNGKKKKGTSYQQAISAPKKSGGCCLWPFMAFSALGLALVCGAVELIRHNRMMT